MKRFFAFAATFALVLADLAPAEMAQAPGISSIDGQNLAKSFRAQIYRCWNPPLPSKARAATVVKLRIQLDESGRLLVEPELLSQFDTSDPATEVAVMSAKRAVYACGPFKLPSDQYRYWRDIVVTFDPRML